MTGERLRAALGLGFRQLTRARARTTLAVFGVSLAVLLVVLLTGLGYGMSTTGQEAMTWIDQEIWVTQGPLELAPGTVGGVRNTLVDAHEVSRDVESVEGVVRADAIAFQSVYVGNGSGEYQTVIGVGVTGKNRSVVLSDAFEYEDRHYANGTYEGNMTREVVVSRGTASALNVSTGETIQVGGTLATAREQEFRVVGIVGGYSNFLGAPTAVLHLSEFQTVTGTAVEDRASMIAVSVAPDADVSAVQSRIQRRHPDLQVRTQDEQYRAVFRDQSAVLAAGVTLVVVALLSGIGLVGNVLALVVYEQRAAFAAARAAGIRPTTLGAAVVSQGLTIAVLGGALGAGIAPFAVDTLNGLVAGVVGFSNLIKTPPWVYAVGFGIAIGIGLFGSAVASLRLSNVSPLTHLDR